MMRGTVPKAQGDGAGGLLERALRFAGVGACATLLHICVAIAVAQIVASPQIANAAGFCAAVMFSYLGHFHVTFRLGTDQGARHPVHFPRFVATALLGLGVSAGLVEVLTVRLGLNFAQTMIAVAIAVPGLSFVLSTLWAFRVDTPGAKQGRMPSALVGTVLSGTIAAVFLALQLGQTVNHDTAWYLVATRAWLDGAGLYSDIIEINPPLAFYLTAPAILLADLTGWSDVTALYVFLATLFFVSVRWVWAVFEQEETMSAERRIALTAGFGAALLAPVLLYAGQREQIMTVLTAPWVAGWLIRPSGGRGKGAILRAAVAAIGLCLKPHFMAIPFALTLAEMLHTRTLRPLFAASTLTIGAVGCAYVAAVWVLHPDYITAVVPMGLAVYDAYGLPLMGKLYNLHPLIVIAILATSLAAWRPGDRTQVIGLALIAGSVGFYVSQGKGFAYHSVPIVTSAALVAVWIICDGSLGRPARVMAAGVLALVAHDAIDDGRYANTAIEVLEPELRPLLAESREDHSILVLATGLEIAFPLVLELETGWASRYPVQWLVPGALRGLEQTDCTEMPDRCSALRTFLDRQLFDTVADVARAKPEVIVVDPWHRQPPRFEIDHLDLLRQTEGGAEALSHYTHVGDVLELQILKRKTD